jgi:hypothetical protein
MMIEAIEAAFYEGKLLCAFPTREECKEYIRKNLPDIDHLEVQLKTQYVSDYMPTGYCQR